MFNYELAERNGPVGRDSCAYGGRGRAKLNILGSYETHRTDERRDTLAQR